MRIIAGEHRSRVIKTCTGDTTRPTLDKVKEAIFSSVGTYFDGGKALDLFAGSGSIGLECISRGMDECIFVDIHQGAISVIKENIKSLKLEENTEVWKLDFQRALQQCVNKGYKFDFIYLDPPYLNQQINLILKFIDANELLNKKGIIVCETLKEDEFDDSYQTFIKKKDSIYGITRVTYYGNEDF